MGGQSVQRLVRAQAIGTGAVRKARWPLIGLMIVVVCSCSTVLTHQPACYTVHRLPNLDISPARRVLVMPFANHSRYDGGAVSLQLAVFREMQTIGWWEMVLADTNEDTPSDGESLARQARFDEGKVLTVAKKYHADLVLFGVITEYHPYLPPRIGLNLYLVAPAEAKTVVAVEGIWDARQRHIADQARAYYRVVVHSPERDHFADMVFMSPRLFEQFVAFQAVRALLAI